jgi:hypothetical protein
MKRRLGAALAAVLALLTAAPTTAAHAGPALAAKPTPDCPLDQILQPTCPGRALFGGWSKGYATGSFRSVVEAADQRYGRPMDVVHMYHAPANSPVPFGDDKFGQAEKHFTVNEGRIVLANFKPGGNDFGATASGANDATIRAAARNIKAVGPHKVMVALQHEPENDISGGTSCPVKAGNPDGNTPQAYRAMWRRTRALFDEEGATNVVWVMNYMSLAKWDCLIDELWPGDDLVDWVAYDPYSLDGGTAEITRFADLLAAQSDANHNYADKPLMLAEYGVHIRPDTTDDARRESARATARSYYNNVAALLDAQTVKNLKALVVFDSKTGANAVNFGVGVDAWGAEDPQEQAAFNRLAANPAFLTR